MQISIHQRTVRLLMIAVLLWSPWLVMAQATKADTIKNRLSDSLRANIPEMFGELNPGKGFQVASTKMGTLNISGYMLARWIDQLPPNQNYFDHLGNELPVNARNDILWHRVQLFFTGWIYSPRLLYNVTVWTVNATNQVAVAGSMSGHFAPWFNLTAGINALPGTRSLEGSHPYWLGSDRVMADEYFRPGFTSGVWATGEVLKTLHYNVMVGDNLSELGIAASKFSRALGYGYSVWWMPTTAEFGPRGAYGDWENHDKIATRFGMSFAHHRESRYSNLSQSSPDNTAIRLSDATLFFATGALAPNVTVNNANYTLYSVDAAAKYKGFFLMGEGYFRTLDKFDADGALPMNSLFDSGFMVQLSGFAIRQKLELYTATSQIYGSFNNANEVLFGTNFYPFDNRNMRINGQVILVSHSPVSSVFGYYTAGQTGTTLSIGASILF